MKNNQFEAYNTGFDFWHDTMLNNGFDKAVEICKRHFDFNLKRECSEDEKKICRELFAVMTEVMASQSDYIKLVYPYDFETSNERLESTYYHANQKCNQECARAIDDAIKTSSYSPNYYNLEIAAMKVVLDYGFSRVNLVLAFNIQQKEHDGRLSTANKQWAKEFFIQEKAFNSAWLKSHSILIEGFTYHIRNLYTIVDAGRFSLPGQKEHGESKPVHGYQIIRSITFSTSQGFAIGYNPNAPNAYVCWKFTIDSDKRDYFWGYYVSDEQSAIDNYIARVFAYLN